MDLKTAVAVALAVRPFAERAVSLGKAAKLARLSVASRISSPMQGQSPMSDEAAKNNPAWMQARRRQVAIDPSARFPILRLKWWLACSLVMSVARSPDARSGVGGD